MKLVAGGSVMAEGLVLLPHTNKVLGLTPGPARSLSVCLGSSSGTSDVQLVE